MRSWHNVVGGSLMFPCIIGVIGWMAVPLVVAASTPLPPIESYSAVAQPWRDVDLSFSRPGRVVKILVHRGQVVKAGQLLAEENDQQQKIADQLAKLSANSTLRIQAAQAELAQDTVSLNRTQWAASQHAANAIDAQLDNSDQSGRIGDSSGDGSAGSLAAVNTSNRFELTSTDAALSPSPTSAAAAKLPSVVLGNLDAGLLPNVLESPLTNGSLWNA